MYLLGHTCSSIVLCILIAKTVAHFQLEALTDSCFRLACTDAECGQASASCSEHCHDGNKTLFIPDILLGAVC